MPPPCWYSKGRCGAEMFADSNDPHYYGLAHHVGENHDDWFPPTSRTHKDDDGNCYSWECDSGNFDGSIQDFFKYVDQWSAAEPGLIWVPAGQAPAAAAGAAGDPDGDRPQHGQGRADADR